MTETSELRKMTRRELLDFRERAWRARLKVVSLAAEALESVSQAHREQALVVLGTLYRKEETAYARERLLRRWPALHVLATAGVGADRYERGTFWPKLADLLEVRNTQAFHYEWGEAFLANLSLLDLPTLDDQGDELGMRYVGSILMHAGMPTYCLSDFFKILDYKRSVVPGLSPEGFVSWAATRAEGVGLAGVDKPVQRFLRFGREFAVDVSDRAFDLLDTVAGGSDGQDVPLPERFREAARWFVAERGASLVKAGSGGRGTAEMQPCIVIDPFGLGPLLKLPPVGDAPDGRTVWVVGMDGDTQRITTQPLWPGSREPAPYTDVAIHSPIRSATVAIAGREHLQTRLSVVDDHDPLLTFNEDGDLLVPRLPLPARPTWFLLPGEPDALLVEGESGVVTESPLPPGWSGWSLLRVDLSQCAAVRLEGRKRHLVRTQATARIDVLDPLEGIRTLTGEQVVASVPSIAIPEALRSATWDVTVTDSTGRTVARWRSSDGGPGPDSIWEGLSRPIIGTYVVRARGPWGRGASRTVTLVEGLRVSFNPGWRRFIESGLLPTTAQLSCPGADLSRESIAFGAQDKDSFVRVSVGQDARSLVVTPPHMSVAYQSPGWNAGASVRPLRLSREDVVAQPGTLIVDLGRAAEPTLYALAPTGPVQSITPAVGRAGVFRFDLAKLTDTLNTNAQLQLSLSPQGEILLAGIRPSQLFTAITLEADEVVFTNCHEIEGLTALVYATYAPWRPPAMLPIRSGRALLPECLRSAGPLRVLARVEDPWAPQEVPDWPEASGSILLMNEGHVADDDREATALSAFLSGEGPFPQQISDFSRLWTVRGRLGVVGPGPRIQEVADIIDAAVHGSPRAALLALTASRAPRAQIPALIVRAHLAEANLRQAHDDDAPTWSTRGALPATLLSAADEEWSEDEVEAAMDVCGDVVSALLLGKDPYAGMGRLDRAAEIFDRSPTQREEFARRAGLVPQGLLSGDSRVLASMELVKVRHDPRLRWLTENMKSLLAQTAQMVKLLEDPVAQAAFDARRSDRDVGSWRDLPALSLGLSLAARHACRGHVLAAAWMPKWSRAWADLAIVVPGLVTIDLILAELLVAGSLAQREAHT